MHRSHYIFMTFIFTILFNTIITSYGYSALPWAQATTSTLQETDTWLFDVAKYVCMVAFLVAGVFLVMRKSGWLYFLIPLAGYGIVAARKTLFDWAATIFGA